MLKIFIASFLCSLYCVILSAQHTLEQDAMPFWDKKSKARWAFHPEEKRFALCDRKGRPLTDFVFEYPAVFDGDAAIAKKRGQYCFLYRDGTTSEGYAFILPAPRGLYWTPPYGSLFDKSGRRKIQSYGFNTPSGYFIFEEKGKYGIMDTTQKVRVDPLFEHIEILDASHAVYKKGGKYGLMTINGKKISENIYERVELHSSGLFEILRKEEGYGLMDSHGKILLEPLYADLPDFPFSDGLGPIRPYKTLKYGFLDTALKIKIPCIYDEMGAFVQGKAFARKQAEIFIIDTSGRETRIGTRHSMLLLGTDKVLLTDGSIRNLEGRILASGYEDQIIYLHDSLWAIKQKTRPGQHAYDLARSGKTTILTRSYRYVYKEPYTSNKSWTVVDSLGNFGIIDAEGREVQAPIFKRLDWDSYNEIYYTCYRDSMARHFKNAGQKSKTNDCLRGILDQSGNILIEPSYSYHGAMAAGGIGWFKRNHQYYSAFSLDSIPEIVKHRMYKDSLQYIWGYISKDGREVLTAYDDVEDGRSRQADYLHAYSQKTIADGIIRRGNFEGFAKIYVRSKWGLFSGGRRCEVLPPVYDAIERVAPDVVSFKEKGRWGLIDTFGKILLKPKYDSIFSFTEGWAVVILGKKYGLIDKAGQEIYNYTNSDCLKPSENGVVLGQYDGVYQYMGGGYWHTISEEYPEELIVEEFTKKIEEDDLYIPFPNFIIWQNTEGGQATKILQYKDGKYLYNIKKDTGTVVFIFERARFWTPDLLLVKQGNKFGLIDTNGREIQPIVYDEIATLRQNGTAQIIQSKKLGLIDKNGKMLCPPVYSEIYPFNGTIKGLAHVIRNGLHGYIDTTCREIIPVQYTYVRAVNNQVVVVELGKKYGLIHIKSRRSTPLEYDGIRVLENGLIVVLKNGKKGILNYQLRLVVPPLYDDVHDAGNAALLIHKGKFGFADTSGAVLIPPQFDAINNRPETGLNWFRVKKNGRVGWVDAKGKMMIPFRFDDATPFFNGYARVLIGPYETAQTHMSSGDLAITIGHCFPVEYLINTKGEIVGKQ
jgi:WG containing repeat